MPLYLKLGNALPKIPTFKHVFTYAFGGLEPNTLLISVPCSRHPCISVYKYTHANIPISNRCKLR